ncbi:hypothetical protein LPTSP4_29150 [Leptospira ryugenii]|uniref:DUF7840 domain-containing protein n=1 Tax=Leptospira ryugenii TaxID=1917863 RepID=A0A2P2E3E4_9LEPT|nr:hypothetical protein [Leptospira ryugenii]GBF51379.1 hypothetical protein LPTSP4_29150 [Leptospira ryugenii]
MFLIRFLLLVILFSALSLLIEDSLSAQVLGSQEHGNHGMGLTLGHSSKGAFSELDFRYKSHDLLNYNQGYQNFSERSVLKGKVRYYSEEGKWELFKLDFYQFLSLNQTNSFFTPNSVGFKFGFESVTIQERTRILNLNGNDEKRITALNIDWKQGYSLLGSQAKEGERYSVSFLGGIKAQYHPSFKQNVRMGPQLSLLYTHEFGRYKLILESTYFYFRALGERNDFQNSLMIRYSLDVNQELRLGISQSQFMNDLTLQYLYLF